MPAASALRPQGTTHNRSPVLSARLLRSLHPGHHGVAALALTALAGLVHVCEPLPQAGTALLAGAAGGSEPRAGWTVGHRAR